MTTTKYKVLVYPSGTEIGLEIGRSLKFSKHFEPIGYNSIHDHSEMIYRQVIYGAPYVDDKRNIVKKISKLIRDEKIDFLFPAHDEIIECFSSLPLGVRVIAPPKEVSSILRYKSSVYNKLKGVHYLPKIYDRNQDSIIKNREIYPLFVRPDRGQGSIGASRVDSYDELVMHLTKCPLVITEFLPGQEYTVDCFTDKNRKLKFLSARERTRIKGGISVRVNECNSSDFINIAEDINSKIHVVGAWFFQCKRDYQDRLKLLEVANRIAGSMGYERIKGVNLVEASLWEILGKNVTFIKNKEMKIVYDRALDESVKLDEEVEAIYVDFDDTLIFSNGCINYDLVGLLFGLKYNKKIPVYLITKSKENINDYIKHMSLGNFFDKVIQISQNECKSDYIQEGKVIFIDDSFSERLSVSTNHPFSICLGLESQTILNGFLFD